MNKAVKVDLENPTIVGTSFLAKRWGVCAFTVNRRIWEGDLGGFQIGRRWFVRWDEALRFEAEGAKTLSPKARTAWLNREKKRAAREAENQARMAEHQATV